MNANNASDSDENPDLAKEKNDLLRQIDFLNSIILDTKLKEPNKSKSTLLKNADNYISIKKTNQFAYNILVFFRCGQLIFRMADCEVDGATRYCKPPVASLSRWPRREAEGNDSEGKIQREKR
ncbi:hypothetical protein TNCV_4225481 [Trichonephila clavipes]|uniref:Uncharacterized protein n=1 Tax=Trichonephila clavipes TaxID=2585209 RepID=A0A8X6SSG6_TRICX|nr:hypothetical protein TNCV_4225481 [Trichonephila clavipes]